MSWIKKAKYSNNNIKSHLIFMLYNIIKILDCVISLCTLCIYSSDMSFRYLTKNSKNLRK